VTVELNAELCDAFQCLRSHTFASEPMLLGIAPDSMAVGPSAARLENRSLLS
jgi:hypothetical protein